MKKNRIFIPAVICVLLAVLALFIISACTQTPDEKTPDNQSEYKIDTTDPAETLTRPNSDTAAADINEPEQIRVFENGNANIKLFSNGNFIANLFHNTKITGTYTEMTQNDETAVLFNYNGITTLEGEISAFEASGSVTAVGGIVNNILTIPEDWDDGHNHGMNFAYRTYPLVFAAGDNDQKITLYADNTFVANFADGVIIIGYYVMRATSVTFVPGSSSSNRDGDIVGTFLLAQLTTVGGDGHHQEDEYEQDDDCDEENYEHDQEEKILILEIPELWAEVSGGSTFILQ